VHHQLDAGGDVRGDGRGRGDAHNDINGRHDCVGHFTFLEGVLNWFPEAPHAELQLHDSRLVHFDGLKPQPEASHAQRLRLRLTRPRKRSVICARRVADRG
jgi:hypothetical protein